MKRLLFVCIGLTLSLGACRSEKTNNGDGADAGDSVRPDAAPGASTTVYDVQSDATPIGSSVSLRSVVVTAIDTFGARTGGVYVQEQDGGAFSGVFVFVSGSASSGLAVGDVVDVDGGIKEEFAFSEFEDGQSVTQVTPADGGAITITKKSSGATIAPEIVNSWDLAADDAEAEKWEGVLIQFAGMKALGGAYSVSQSDSTLMEMSITGPYRAGGSLALLSGERDDCYSSITGVGDYFFNYKILPRSSADLVVDAAGTSCLSAEDSDALCTDSMDNDHDGFSDCSDFSCQDAVASCTVESTVVEAQNGTIAENTRIRLTDVLVTAVSADNKSFWVQDEVDTAVAFNGLFVYRRDTATNLPSNMVGKKVSLVGNVDEFNGQITELTNLATDSATGDGTFSPTGNGTITTVTGVSLADLASIKDYEGVLVEVADATVVTGSGAGCSEFCKFTIGTQGNEVYANDTIFRHSVTAAACYSSFTGIMHYDDYDSSDDGVFNPPGIVILPLEDGLGSSCM